MANATRAVDEVEFVLVYTDLPADDEDGGFRASYKSSREMIVHLKDEKCLECLECLIVYKFTRAETLAWSAREFLEEFTHLQESPSDTRTCKHV